MQRLFSMFPAGTAGVALFLLRISVALSLLVDGNAYWALLSSLWGLPALPALLLVVGFLTPYAAGITCLMELGVVIVNGGQHPLPLLLSILNSGVVALIGPGAYSADARIFGRRLLTATPRK